MNFSKGREKHSTTQNYCLSLFNKILAVVSIDSESPQISEPLLLWMQWIRIISSGFHEWPKRGYVFVVWKGWNMGGGVQPCRFYANLKCDLFFIHLAPPNIHINEDGDLGVDCFQFSL